MTYKLKVARMCSTNILRWAMTDGTDLKFVINIGGFKVSVEIYYYILNPILKIMIYGILRYYSNLSR